MGDPRTQIEEESPAQVPFLDPENTHEEEEEEEEKDTHLDRILQYLDIFLCFFGFHRSSLLGFLLSWAAFLFIGVSLPVVILILSRCSECKKYQIYSSELDIIVSQSCFAAVSLACVSHNLRKYGIRNFLFVDRFHGQMLRFRKEYIEKIKGFFRLLILWMLPCFLLKTAYEVICIIYVSHYSWWQSVVMLLVMVFSWAYLTTISLSACLLFNLVCNLQVIHLDNYVKFLESNSDVSVFIEEHLRLTHYLSKLSHRFRIFLLLALLIVTASEVVAVFRATSSSFIINFINGGDFAAVNIVNKDVRDSYEPSDGSDITSIVQVVGIVLCLNAAAKISRRTQGIVSFACRWHALVTCSSNDASESRVSNSAGNLEATLPSGSLFINFSESDLDSLDYLAPPINTQPVSDLSTFRKRQAFVAYLQSNPGGITIFGWTIDRALINTLFFLEFSLVLFVLGKTLVF